MKKLIAVALLGALGLISNAYCQIEDPGWFPVPSRDADSGALEDFVTGGIQSHLVGSGEPASPVAEIITPEIQALADGLQDDPLRIFNYVHDHIRFVLYFGSKKGAALTLLEKSGNDFDQCALLMALLRAAGYTNAHYKFGWQEIPYDSPYSDDYDLHHWLQLTLANTNWSNTVAYFQHLLGVRGYPQFYTGTDQNTLAIQRVWVSLPVGTNTYQLDPAFKISEPASGIVLTNAFLATSSGMSNALMTAAGGTNNGNFVQNMSESSVRGALTGYASNFLNYIQNSAPNASVQNILGGWNIVPAYDPDDYYATDTWFPKYDFGGQMPILTWFNEPTNIMSTVRISLAGTNYQCFIPQLQGNRLSLVYDTNGLSTLWLDDSNILQKATTAADTNVTIFVHHPYGKWDTTNNLYVDSTNTDHTATVVYQRTNAMYALMYGFEPDWGWLHKRQNKLEGYLQRLSTSSREVTTETLNVMGLNWMLQSLQTESMLAQQLGILPEYMHQIGRMGQESGHGYYIDVYMLVSGQYPNGGSDPAHLALYNMNFDLSSFFGSALEHGIIEQLQNTNIVGASTVKMLEIASANAQPIFLASATNWNSGGYVVRTKLTNYTASTLATISNLVNKGSYVLLPSNGSNHVSNTTGSWAGYGYEARHTGTNGLVDDSLMAISGGYYGGYSSDFGSLADSGFVNQSGTSQPGSYTGVPTGSFSPSGADPVDLANGTFKIENTDLAVGAAEPRGISLSRYNNGTRRFSNAAGMAPGWTHNYVISANSLPAPQACLGGSTPAQAASMVTATAAAIALYNGGIPNAKNWMLTHLIAKWAVDQLTRGGVSVILGKDTLQFVQQPNGAFTPPANCTATLARNNNAYALSERHGNIFQFNQAGLLTNIVDQYSQSLNVTYTNNLVRTVKDWKNRTFTFSYSGSPSRLSSVTDGTRTVNYSYSTAYSPQGDLTGFTDPEGQPYSYVYDTNHQIIATFDPQSRLIVTNILDTEGHVAMQLTENKTNKLWHIYWSGWQTTQVDPAGGKTDYLFDDQGRLITVFDPLGFETDSSYDGQNHVTNTVSPLGETNRYIFDGNQNLIETIDPLGFSNLFIFDGQFNLIHTVDQRGNTNSFAYNSQFSLTQMTNAAGDFTNYAYNVDGTVQFQTNAAGATGYTYDSNGLLQTIRYPGNLGTEGFLNSAPGDVLQHTNALGFITINGYNNRRELTNSIAPSNVVSSVTFDSCGNVAKNIDARGNVSTNSWSATRHLLSKTLPPTPAGTATFSNVYDNRDLLLQSLDPLHKATTFSNDLNGRLVFRADPLWRVQTFGYDRDGRQTAATNASTEVTRQRWSSRGDLLNTTNAATHTVLRGYDAVGNQITLTNRNGKRWQFKFDEANRVTNTISPMGRSNSVTFNHLGLIATIKDAALHSTTFNFDAKGRKTNRVDSIGTTLYGFDAADGITNVSEGSLTNSWTRDAYGHANSFKDCFGNIIQYRFDANGNMTNLIYPGNRNVYYQFDSRNQLTNVTDWLNQHTTFAYDLAGRMTNITRPNGTQRATSCDDAGEITNIVELSSGFPIVLFRFNYNSNATVQSEFVAPIPHTNSPPSRSMMFDDDNRLATFNGNAVTTDTDGNLTFGPLTNDTFSAYNYDVRNRLLSAGGLSYGYDPANNRVSVTNGTNIALFVINPNAALPQVLMRISGTTTNYYIYGAGLLYQITETASATSTLTYHFDNRGSTAALTDATGHVTDRIEYSAYGTITYRIGTNDTPFLFNGRFGVQTDANGLLYMRARYYNPYICRFINPDPSGFSAGLNFYAYANGDPISLVDPFGLGAEPSTWELFGNGLNNTATAVGQSFGQGLYDFYNGGRYVLGFGTESGYSWDGSRETYSDIYNQMYSVQTPANPAATPYIVGALGVSTAAISVAGFAGTWELAGLPTMDVAVGPGVPFHVAYGSGGTWVNAIGSTFGNLTVSGALAGDTVSAAYFTVTGIPVLNSVAVTATGGTAWTCVTAAGSAFVRGWFP